ncbi:hypothetical protein [Actinomadura miaoliensis]|uniref:SbtR family transcriptional regulator n=1 Tax=Actinomadura miaoliensis TaxID=430685 RepID=UPI003CD08E8B
MHGGEVRRRDRSAQAAGGEGGGARRHRRSGRPLHAAVPNDGFGAENTAVKSALTAADFDLRTAAPNVAADLTRQVASLLDRVHSGGIIRHDLTVDEVMALVASLRRNPPRRRGDQPRALGPHRPDYPRRATPPAPIARSAGGRQAPLASANNAAPGDHEFKDSHY